MHNFNAHFGVVFYKYENMCYPQHQVRITVY